VAAFFGPLLVPARASLSALLGLWVAREWYDGSRWWWPLLAAAVLIAAAYILDAAGRRQLPARPVAAVALMEFWVAAPLCWTALASAAVIIIGVELNADPKAPTADQQMTKALAAAMTSFLSAGFIAWAGDQNKSPVAQRIQQAFEKAYKNVTMSEAAERLVYSDAVQGIEGWSASARAARAAKLQQALRSP
jgi:hypothetical protein